MLGAGTSASSQQAAQGHPPWCWLCHWQCEVCRQCCPPCPLLFNAASTLLCAASPLQAVLLPVLAGVALREAFPAAVAALRPLATLAAASFLALNTAAYVAHSGAAVAHAWPRLALAVTALHSGEACW